MTKSLKVQGFARSDGPIGGFVNGKRLTIDKNQGSPPSIKTGKGYSLVKKTIGMINSIWGNGSVFRRNLNISFVLIWH